MLNVLCSFSFCPEEERWTDALSTSPGPLGPWAHRTLQAGSMTGKLRHVAQRHRHGFAGSKNLSPLMSKFISNITASHDWGLLPLVTTSVPRTLCKWDSPPHQHVCDEMPPAPSPPSRPRAACLSMDPSPPIYNDLFFFSYWHWLVLGNADSDELNSFNTHSSFLDWKHH